MSTEIKETIPFQPSTIETIDYAVYDWVNGLNLHTTTNKGWEPVSIYWYTEERTQESKSQMMRRERKTGTVILPVMVVERTGVVKDPTRKGTAWANVPHETDAKGGAAAITIARRINQDKTSNFANAEAKRKKGQINFPRRKEKVVYETISIPMPVYIEATYEIKIRTQYQQQMNDLVQPFMTKTGGINYTLLKREGHRYEGFIQSDFSQNNTAGEPGDDEQKYETTITLKVLGYLIGAGKNQEQPKIVIRENAVEFKMPKERIVMGDEPEHTDKQGYVGKQGIKK